MWSDSNRQSSMIRLHFINETARSPRLGGGLGGGPATARDFTSLLKKTAAQCDIPEKEVELVLMEDAAIQAINKATRGLDKPTDVLSFASREEEGATDPTSLGQIFISIPAAERNAAEIGQSLRDELRFLFVHGLLHILGYDHQTPTQEQEMMALAYQILGRPPYTI